MEGERDIVVATGNIFVKSPKQKTHYSKINLTPKPDKNTLKRKKKITNLINIGVKIHNKILEN